MKSWVRTLQKQVDGFLTEEADMLDYFSTDGSIFTMRPQAVFYPKNTQDIQQAVTFLAEKAYRGEKISIVARGKGTDQSGGAVGDGLMVVFPAHMNKLVRMDKNTVTMQPGMIYRDLQNTLRSHGRFLPPYPASIDFCTIGGAVANNSCGEKTIKYGSTRDYVKSLKVVLADGSEIETRRLTPRQLNKKKGQTDLEGDIYRKLDDLIIENQHLIKGALPDVDKNAAGLALWSVKKPDGSFDLSPLITGSQGTLGIITEITLRTLPYNPKTTLVVGYFGDMEQAGAAVLKLLPLGPSTIEIVDYHLLDFLQRNHPKLIEGVVPDPLPQIVLLIEFDDASQVRQKIKTQRTLSILKKHSASSRVSAEPKEQAKLWQIRHSAAAVIWMSKGTKKALPIIEDGVVPVAKMSEFLTRTYKILRKHKLEIAVWGHAGNANFHMQPFLDLGKLSDRKKVFEVMDEFYDMVIKLGGSTSGEHNDGLLRAPYLEKLYGQEMYDLFVRTEKIFDPQGILNPNKIVEMTHEDLLPLVRHEYSMKHLYDHMLHTK